MKLAKLRETDIAAVRRQLEDRNVLNPITEIKKDARKEGRAEGRAIGLDEGLAKGLSQGLSQGLSLGEARGKIEEIRRLLARGRITLEVARAELQELIETGSVPADLGTEALAHLR